MSNIEQSGYSGSMADYGTAKAKPRVAIIYHFMPHYRRAVFSKLLNSGTYDFEIYYGTNRVDATIKTHSDLPGTHQLAVHRIGPIFWQSGVGSLFSGRRYEAAIFLGQVNILSYWIDASRARLSGAKVLFWTHGWTSNEQGLKSAIRIAFYRIAHVLLLYGHRAKKIGTSKRFNSENLAVIYNSLDYDAQKAVRMTLEVAGDTTNPLARDAGASAHDAPCYFVCVSRLVPDVRLDLAISALSMLSESDGPTAPLILIGDGPERARLEQQARQRSVNVVFLGALYDEVKIGPWLYHARALVSPGKVGLTAMHGLAYGTAVITSDNLDGQRPEFEAITPGLTGDFFEDGDAADLAKVLQRWLDKPRTADERAAAIKTIEDNYTPQRQVELIEEELDRLLPAATDTHA